MTLHDLLTVGGIALSLSLLAVLASLRPGSERRRSLCFKTCVDETCTARCLRRCHLVPVPTRHREAALVG
ncbi:MAG TPA: hypothetical protein VFP65_07770 [Anaeromyxobacteraceae bacterium]|nr:hypothetical protein [Anaeromyxobacteraceae bacterium]